MRLEKIFGVIDSMLNNIEEVKNKIVDFIRAYFIKNGKDCNAIIGISGGKDSAVVAALCVEALGADRVIGIQMPCGKQSDIEYSNKIINILGIKKECINIEPFVSLLDKTIPLNDAAKISAKARTRMITLYAYAQTHNGRVVGTENKSEHLLGYFTRFGDAASDVEPIRDLFVSEVKQIGYCLGLPQDIIEKEPSDGLTGQTDEEALGFTYDEAEKFFTDYTALPDDKWLQIQRHFDANNWKLREVSYPSIHKHLD